MFGVKSINGVSTQIFVDSGRTTLRENSNCSTPEAWTTPCGNSDVTRNALESKSEHEGRNKRKSRTDNFERYVRIVISLD
jgi:hypothetical protein